MVEQANWSIQGPDLDLTHLREPDVRLKLLDIPENKLADYRVRHGRGDWNDAAKVFEVFRNLARHGCYLRVGRCIEGPFTLQRAVELVQRRVRKNPRVRKKLRIRVGRESRWQNVDDFESWCLTHSANLRGAADSSDSVLARRSSVAPVQAAGRTEVRPADASRSVIPAGAVDGLFANRADDWSNDRQSDASCPALSQVSESINLDDQPAAACVQTSEPSIGPIIQPTAEAISALSHDSAVADASDRIDDSTAGERTQLSSTPASEPSSPRLLDDGDQASITRKQSRGVGRRWGSSQQTGRWRRKNVSKRKKLVGGLRTSSDTRRGRRVYSPARLATPSSPRKPLAGDTATESAKSAFDRDLPDAQQRPARPLVEPAIQAGVAHPSVVDGVDEIRRPGGRPLPPLAAHPRRRQRDHKFRGAKLWGLAIVASMIALAGWFYPAEDGDRRSAFIHDSWRDEGSGSLPHGHLVLTNATAPTESRFVSESIPSGMLFTPSIETPDGTARNFHCFAAYASKRNRPVLLSALSLLGPRGGLKQPITALDAFTSVRSVDLCDLQTGQVMRQVPGTTVIVPGADHWPASSLHGDVFAFRPHEDLHLRPLSLASRLPDPGQEIWLLHRCGDAAAVTQGVIESTEGAWGVFSIPATKMAMADVQQLSGAPILNNQDEVVGIVAWVERINDQLIGRLTPAHQFAEYL